MIDGASLNRLILSCYALTLKLYSRRLEYENNLEPFLGEPFLGNLFWGREIEYPSESVGQLDLAYALTIHRSQGSEVPAVVLVLHDTHNIMLERQLIYTGITRAKRLLVVVGTRKALAIATSRSRSRRRYSHLRERTSELLTSSSL